MKARIKHIYEIIAGAILSLLGFNGCNENIFLGPPEYGMPHATFEVKGTVKAEDTGESVKGIKVKLRHYTEGMEDENGNPRYTELEMQSDQDGKVDGYRGGLWPYYDDLQITFEDVDGGENGGWFAPDTIKVSDLNITLEEDKKSTWNKGTYHISFDEKLKRDYTEPVD